MVRTAAGRGAGEEPLINVKLQQSLSVNAKSVLDLHKYDIFNFGMDKSRDQTVLNRTNGLLVQQHVVVAAAVDVVV